MKTGQMLFIAFGGMMLGAAGTLAIQTGLVHYEVTLDIRPRGAVTLPPPALASSVDPYLGPSIGQPQPALENTVQSWQPEPPSTDLPVALPPLDEQQVAEIVAIRQQIGHPVSKQLSGLVCPAEEQCESFADHLRAAAGTPPSAAPTIRFQIYRTLAMTIPSLAASRTPSRDRVNRFA